jgi:hypothetical protein
MAATTLKTHVVAPEERSSAKGVLGLLAEAGGGGIGEVKLVFESALGRKSAVVMPDGLLDVIRDLAGLIEGGAASQLVCRRSGSDPRTGV